MSLFTEYDIAAPGQSLYAKKQFLSLFSKVELKDASERVIARLQGQFSILRNKYECDLTDGRVFRFECTDRLRNVYECRSGDDVYALYEHRGLSRSIFRNEQQIGAYSKSRVTFGKGHRYEIRMDNDADLTVVVCMVLALSVGEDNGDEQSTVNFDFGNIGFQGREIDDSWEPK